ncbi:hypothetical protein [Streptomyces sp. NPDC056069]|uniref:hypothetical protein n=1 Tax=Streptomyces sp. NPDC056069 TaxID=3345702 RepID=UPI0035E3A04A
MTTLRMAYLIEDMAPTTPDDRRFLSVGTRTLPDGWGPRALAEELVRETRGLRPWLGTGPVRCSVWVHHPEELLPTDPEEAAAPPDADQFQYGA